MVTPLVKIKKEDFAQIQMDAAMILNKFDTTGHQAVQPADIVCLTTGDVGVNVTPQTVDQGEDVNGCPPGLAELMDIQGWDAKISFTALNITPEILALSLGAADVASDHVTPRSTFNVAKDFKDTWLVGKKTGGGVVAVQLKKALSSAGLQLTTTKNGKGQLAVELTGHPSIDDEDPYAPPVDFWSTAASPAMAANVEPLKAPKGKEGQA